jgi:adenylate cyclase
VCGCDKDISIAKVLVQYASVSRRIKAYLNIKSAALGISRLEFEYPLPVRDVEQILDKLCLRPLIEKTRHLVLYAGHRWEIDVFEGENAGLIVAEIELNDPDEAFELPDWVGKEVSHDPRYYNVCLVKDPYKNWGAEASWHTT